MGKRLGIFIALASFTIVAGMGSWLYFKAGMKAYGQVVWTIARSSKEEKEFVRQYWGDDGETLGGVLAGVSANRRWMFIWTGGRIKRLAIGNSAVFSYYDICEAAKTNGVNQPQGDFVVDDSVRTVTQDIEAWLTDAVAGSYIQVRVEPAAAGKRLLEAHAYGWPLFLPVRLEDVCGKD